jgi:hypothetical protein
MQNKKQPSKKSSKTQNSESRMPRWFVSLDGETIKGPCTKSELKKIVIAGEMRPDNWVYPENGNAWIIAQADLNLSEIFKRPKKSTSVRLEEALRRYVLAAARFAPRWLTIPAKHGNPVMLNGPLIASLTALTFFISIGIYRTFNPPPPSTQATSFTSPTNRYDRVLEGMSYSCQSSSYDAYNCRRQKESQDAMGKFMNELRFNPNQNLNLR